MSPSDMSNYRILRTIVNAPSCKLMVLEDGLVLKLRPMLVDVDVIVRNMKLASIVTKVPKVYKYGYSGNSAFILMAYVHPAANLQVMFEKYGDVALHSVEPQLWTIVRDLARLGISHNDLYPRNILVDRDWEVVAVLDWDESGPLVTSREYERRVCWEFDTHSWDYIFLANSGDPFGCLDPNPDHVPHVLAPLIRYPPGRTIGPSQRFETYTEGKTCYGRS